jgi:hypothetical protein
LNRINQIEKLANIIKEANVAKDIMGVAENFKKLYTSGAAGRKLKETATQIGKFREGVHSKGSNVFEQRLKNLEQDRLRGKEFVPIKRTNKATGQVREFNTLDEYKQHLEKGLNFHKNKAEHFKDTIKDRNWIGAGKQGMGGKSKVTAGDWMTRQKNRLPLYGNTMLGAGAVTGVGYAGSKVISGLNNRQDFGGYTGGPVLNRN